MESGTQILIIVLSNIAAMLTFFGIISVMLWNFRKDSKEDWVRTEAVLKGIQAEMKDFHDRLVKIEAEREVWRG